MSDFGSGLEQYGPQHEMSGRASRADLRKRIAELEASKIAMRATITHQTNIINHAIKSETHLRDRLASLLCTIGQTDDVPAEVEAFNTGVVACLKTLDAGGST